MRIPDVSLYLFYGTKTEAILKARDEVVERRVAKEARDENLTERFPSGSQHSLELAPMMDEIAGDLSTMSFIPDATKCYVIMNPAELLVGKSKAKKPPEGEAFMMQWLEEELPKSEHLIILLLFEDEADGRMIDERNGTPLFKLVQKIGWSRRFRDDKAFFKIEETLIARNTSGFFTAVRSLWKAGKGDQQVYNSLIRTLRYLLQANIVHGRRRRGEDATLDGLLPNDARSNIVKVSPFVQKKYLDHQIYRTIDLLEAYDGMLEVYRAMRPRPNMLYVPDPLVVLEKTMLKLLSAPHP